MKRIALFSARPVLLPVLCFLFIGILPLHAAERTEVERQLKAERIPILPQKEKVFFASVNEYSWVSQNSRVGNWKLFSNTVSYALTDSISPYIEANIHERFSRKDYTVNFGSYFNFDDHSYLHSEAGFGADIDYVYRFQATQEYGHRMLGNIIWETGAKFLNYPDNDVYIFYPSLFYYFADHYISTSYNISFTEGRGAAQWGTLKSNFSFLDGRFSLWAGTAVGERLYDIDLIKARKQFGYIAFIGGDFKVYKELKIRLGYSYSSEDPDFMKRSLDFGCSLKF